MLDLRDSIFPMLTHRERKRREAELANISVPSVFKVKGQLLDQGRTETNLAATDGLTVRLKIYASGGEIAIHAHPSEDHCFIVLAGSVDFYNPEGTAIQLHRHEGIMLPKGALYGFCTTSKEPLVMLRVGNANYNSLKHPTRTNSQGSKAETEIKKPVIFKHLAYFD